MKITMGTIAGFERLWSLKDIFHGLLEQYLSYKLIITSESRNISIPDTYN
jgi:hypothetical protein